MNYTWGRNLRPSKEFSFPSAQRLGIQLYPITILLLNLALLLFLLPAFLNMSNEGQG